MTRSPHAASAPEPRRIEPGDAPSRLLAAAGPVFAHGGFDGASLREICRRADTNVASVAYYFGDKMGLYRAVHQQMRQSREHRFPEPPDAEEDPRRTLYRLVHTLLSRMLAGDASGWESQLMMREMQRPTPVFTELVEDYFRPLFHRLCQTIRKLAAADLPRHTVEQLALSAVGQCLHYHVGRGVIQILISEQQRRRHYDIASLSRHITAVILLAAEHGESFWRMLVSLEEAPSHGSEPARHGSEPARHGSEPARHGGESSEPGPRGPAEPEPS